MKISVIIHTASPDSFLTVQGITSYFAAVVRCLSWQTFTDIELVYVDAYHEENRESFSRVQAPFQIKHVPVHADHRYWYDLGYTYISAAKNTGILYAGAELLVFFDDAEFFPEHLLASYWHHHEHGQFMHALHKRMRTIDTAAGYPLKPIAGDVYMNDHRWKNVRNTGIYRHQHGSIVFAGTSVSLDAALEINGFNERMDGCKSLEDCDFGSRLVMSGKRFALDFNGYLYILDHPSYADVSCAWEVPAGYTDDIQATKLAPTVKRKIENFIAVENYGVLRASEILFDTVANTGTLDTRSWDIIRQETLKYRGFDVLAEENREKLEIWKGTPTFDLRAQRTALRASADWRW